jgi:hypothetical protein
LVEDDPPIATFPMSCFINSVLSSNSMHLCKWFTWSGDTSALFCFSLKNRESLTMLESTSSDELRYGIHLLGFEMLFTL